jgi:hypothetical protein
LILRWILDIHSQREKPGLFCWITVAYVSLSQEETADYQGESLMTKFKDGDKVKVIDAPEDKQHLVGKIGRVRPPQGFDYDQDLVFVSFDGGVRDGFAEHQLEKVE